MKIVNKIIITIFTIIMAITIIVSYDIYNSDQDCQELIISPVFEFEKNQQERTLTVTDINFDIKWNEITINGFATKPNGKIEVGDQITNCYNTIDIEISTSPIGTWTFDQKTANQKDILVLGDWSSYGQLYEFNQDGSYNFIKNETVSEELDFIPELGYYHIDYDLQEILLLDVSQSFTQKPISLNISFEDNNNTLPMQYDNTSTYIYQRNIYSIDSFVELRKYYYQKIEITGLFTYDNNNSTGEIKINNTNDTIFVLFEETDINSSDYNNKNISIVGFLYQADEKVEWKKPYLNYIEKIEII